MQQQISVITLATTDLPRSRRFCGEGFGWAPWFENDEIAFYQMNGLMLGTWLKAGLEEDSRRIGLSPNGAFALAHNVAGQDDVEPLIATLGAAGGTILRPADAPPHGGYRGYVADPDGHAWEITHNPGWAIDENGLVTFGV
jgi:uncharacterized protein